MATELSLLIPEFRKKVIDLVTACKASGSNIEVIQTIITPLEQASLWRQGRTAADAELKAMALEKAGAPYLAHCIRTAQPKETNLVTDALPGFSWHQWGEAAKCVWIDRTNKLNFSPTQLEGQYRTNGYAVLAVEAAKVGVIHGGNFDDLDQNWMHIQLRPERSPGDCFIITEIDAEMKRRFGR